VTVAVSSTRLVATGQVLMEQIPGGVARERMSSLARFLQGADIAVCNLEVAIETDAPRWPAKEAVLHRAPVEVLDYLMSLGFNALSLANNHAADLGPSALVAALDEIERRGLLHAGAGVDASAAAQVRARGAVGLVAVSAGPPPVTGRALDATGERPARAGVNGLTVRRGVVADPASFAALRRLAVSSGQAGRVRREAESGRGAGDTAESIDFYGVRVQLGAMTMERADTAAQELCALYARVVDAASSGCLPIVSVHYHDWEPDWSTPPAWLSELARGAIDAGACAVIAHGPPVTSALEVYRGRLIAYGLGNLVFHTHRVDGYPQAEVWGSVVLDAELAPDGALVAARLHPVQLQRPRRGEFGFVRPAERDEAEQILARMTRLSAPFGVRLRSGSATSAALEWG
jgi:poly-gamma-glutamate synthesis protein (capsule biosynthesis protein)